MTDEQREAFSEFINTTLYERMELDDYYAVLESLNVQYHGMRCKGACHNTEEELQSAGYHVQIVFEEEKRYFKCWVCGDAMSLLTFVKKVFAMRGEEKNLTQTMKYICDICSIPFQFDVNESTKTKYTAWKSLRKYLPKDKQVVEDKIYDESILDMFDKKYYMGWIDYGISQDVLDKYEVGWYPYRQQITLPCRDYNGNLIGIRVRNLNPNTEAKYIPLSLLDGDSFSFPTSNYFYGEQFNFERIKQSKSCWLFESEKAVLKMETWFPNKSTALGMYGSNFTDIKLKKLLQLGVNTIYIAIDSDFHDIGDEDYIKFEEKVMKIVDKLSPYVQNIYVIYNNCGFDDFYKCNATDGTREQFNEMWKNREKVK